MADKVAIAAGTRVLMRELNAVPAVAEASVIPEVETIGDISEQSAEVTATPLSSKNVRYIRGLTDGQPLEITSFLIADDPVQKRLAQARQKGTELEITVQPDDTSVQWVFRYQPLTHTIRTGAGGDPKRRVIGGRVNSAVTEEPNEHPDYVA